MALEKRLADTDSIYCIRGNVNSNQTSIFICSLNEPQLDEIFGAVFQTDDDVRLRLDKRNLAFNSIAHVLDRRTWYQRRTTNTWNIDNTWLNSHTRLLEEAFHAEKEVFIAKLNKDDITTRRLYIKGIANMTRADDRHVVFSLKEFLFSGDVIILTRLENGDIDFEIRLPNNPFIETSAVNITENPTVSYQTITNGAPGTGKSHYIKKKLENISEVYKERVTFYPTYSYQQFVGAYKPSVENNTVGENQITYSYVPGPFLRLLIKAYQNDEQFFYLIIEELNRANAAAVFGDTFQLLDREEDGTSEYPVAISEDMKRYLTKIDADNDNHALRDATWGYTKLTLPSNFFILATMNSADQGVFPIDTAFKRRWDFNYLGIDTNEEMISAYNYSFKDGKYYWNTIRKTINAHLLAARINEDKLLGPFFVGLNALKAENEMFIQSFKSKVLMYLFEDAVRHNPSTIFKGRDGLFSYSIICQQLEEGGLKDVFNFDIEQANDLDKADDEESQDNT